MENIALVSIDLPLQSAAQELANTRDEIVKKIAPLPSTKPKNTHFSNGGSSDPTLGVKFISAGLAACFADMMTFPLDTAKVRLQIQGEAVSAGTAAARSGPAATTQRAPFGASHRRGFSSMANVPKYGGMFNTLMVISREEGPRALYNGLVPGLQRQMAFASIRIGLYDAVKQGYIDLFRANGLVNESNIGLRILAGITTGAAAVSCAQPTDVVKVRMQAQSTGPRRYTGCMNAYRTIAATEGIRGLWKGTMPNVTRNAIVNAAELVSYDLIKEAILRRRLLSDNMPCHFVSAFGAGFCTTVIASPVDVVKTRFMNSSVGVYKGAFHCATVMFKEGGVRAFYKGFMPSFIRLGSWNIVMFVTYEQLKRFISKVSTTGFPSPHSPATNRSATARSETAPRNISKAIKDAPANNPQRFL